MITFKYILQCVCQISVQIRQDCKYLVFKIFRQTFTFENSFRFTEKSWSSTESSHVPFTQFNTYFFHLICHEHFPMTINIHLNIILNNQIVFNCREYSIFIELIPFCWLFGIFLIFHFYRRFLPKNSYKYCLSSEQKNLNALHTCWSFAFQENTLSRICEHPFRLLWVLQF